MLLQFWSIYLLRSIITTCHKVMWLQHKHKAKRYKQSLSLDSFKGESRKEGFSFGSDLAWEILQRDMCCRIRTSQNFRLPIQYSNTNLTLIYGSSLLILPSSKESEKRNGRKPKWLRTSIWRRCLLYDKDSCFRYFQNMCSSYLLTNGDFDFFDTYRRFIFE